MTCLIPLFVLFALATYSYMLVTDPEFEWKMTERLAVEYHRLDNHPEYYEPTWLALGKPENDFPFTVVYDYTSYHEGPRWCEKIIAEQGFSVKSETEKRKTCDGVPLDPLCFIQMRSSSIFHWRIHTEESIFMRHLTYFGRGSLSNSPTEVCDEQNAEAIFDRRIFLPTNASITIHMKLRVFDSPNTFGGIRASRRVKQVEVTSIETHPNEVQCDEYGNLVSLKNARANTWRCVRFLPADTMVHIVQGMDTMKLWVAQFAALGGLITVVTGICGCFSRRLLVCGKCAKVPAYYRRHLDTICQHDDDDFTSVQLSNRKQ